MRSNLSMDGFEKYERARKVCYSWKDIIKFSVRAFLAYFVSFIQYFPDLLRKIKEILLGIKPKSIDGQLALVTGGARGLGREIAVELAKLNCNLAIVDLDIEEAEKVAKEIHEKFGVKAKAFRTDVSNYEDVQLLQKNIEDSLGFVDILVNNAGLMPFVSLREGTPVDIQKIIDVNLTSHFWTCRTFLNGMIKRKRGHIVAISSLAGILGIPRSCGYCATKYGVRGLMNSLYLELCADDHEKLVNLTTVYPCFISTRKEIDYILDSTGMLSMPLDPSECATIIVRDMLKNRDTIIIPKQFDIMVKTIEWIPKEFWKFFMFNVSKDASFKFLDNGLEKM